LQAAKDISDFIRLASFVQIPFTAFNCERPEYPCQFKSLPLPCLSKSFELLVVFVNSIGHAKVKSDHRFVLFYPIRIPPWHNPTPQIVRKLLASDTFNCRFYVIIL
jgi:hypothetical protein